MLQPLGVGGRIKPHNLTLYTIGPAYSNSGPRAAGGPEVTPERPATWSRQKKQTNKNTGIFICLCTCIFLIQVHKRISQALRYSFQSQYINYTLNISPTMQRIVVKVCQVVTGLTTTCSSAQFEHLQH